MQPYMPFAHRSATNRRNVKMRWDRFFAAPPTQYMRARVLANYAPERTAKEVAVLAGCSPTYARRVCTAASLKLKPCDPNKTYRIDANPAPASVPRGSRGLSDAAAQDARRADAIACKQLLLLLQQHHPRTIKETPDDSDRSANRLARIHQSQAGIVAD